MELSDIILLGTGIFIAVQAIQTRKLVRLTEMRELPFLEVEFQNSGATVFLKNIGQSPAYSPSISSIEIANNERLDFDPLQTSRQSILPNESRKVWMHHQKVNEGSIGGFVDSTPILRNFVLNSNTPVKITLRYFDKIGEKISRDLYITVGGNKISGDQQIYTTTNPKG